LGDRQTGISDWDWLALKARRNISMQMTFSNNTKMRRRPMDWNRVEGNWKQVKGKIKEKWGRLTDDDLDVINGRRDQLEGKIQERYGVAKDRVRKDVDDWYTAQRW
jgi:uncharacterized protein YjbJ (UPF0337 family)